MTMKKLLTYFGTLVLLGGGWWLREDVVSTMGA